MCFAWACILLWKYILRMIFNKNLFPVVMLGLRFLYSESMNAVFSSFFCCYVFVDFQWIEFVVWCITNSIHISFTDASNRCFTYNTYHSFLTTFYLIWLFTDLWALKKKHDLLQNMHVPGYWNGLTSISTVNISNKLKSDWVSWKKNT